MADSSELTLSSEKYLLSAYNTSYMATYIGDCIVHLKLPKDTGSSFVIPGISHGADAELVILKDKDTFTNHLHLLGSSWLADVLNTQTAWLLELISNSALMSTWNIEDIWIAVPLERKNKQEYCMTMIPPESKLLTLMDCKTAIIVDQFAGVADSTLAHCTNSINFLMGKCKLGCAYCSIGLGSAPAK